MMTKTSKDTPVDRDAVIKRVNRILAKSDRKLKTTRAGGWTRITLGDFYTVNTYTNVVAERQLDLDFYARSLGVLASNEYITTRETHEAKGMSA